MRVKRVAVSQFQPVLVVTKFRANHCVPRIGGVDVEPQHFVATDFPDRPDRVHTGSSGGAYCRADKDRSEAIQTIVCNGLSLRVGAHCLLVVDFDQAHVPVSRNRRPFLNGAMGLR